MSDKMLFIPQKDLIELLEKAFEEGWNGFLDLKESSVETILEMYLQSKENVELESKQTSLVKTDFHKLNFLRKD